MTVFDVALLMICYSGFFGLLPLLITLICVLVFVFSVALLARFLLPATTDCQTVNRSEAVLLEFKGQFRCI